MKRKIRFFVKSFIVMILLLLFTNKEGISQTESDNKTIIVENVTYTVSDGKVIVTYDLLGDPKQLYDVKLTLRRSSNDEVKYVPRTVSGDIGEGNFAGNGRQIIWEYEKDFPEGLSGEDYYFVIHAKTIDEGTNIFMWAGLGVAAAAAVVTYIIVGGDNGSSTANQTSSFPFPPGRP